MPSSGINARAHDRHPENLVTAVKLTVAGHPRIAFIRDVSTGGIGLLGDRYIPVGMAVEVDFPSETETPTHRRGTVAWSSPTDRKGLYSMGIRTIQPE